MSEKIQSLTLRTADAYNEDERRGIVRIITPLMLKCGLKTGDVVELISTRTNSRKIGAIVSPGKDVDRGIGIIQMDRFARENLGINLSELVKIRRVNRQEAKQITLAPTKERFRLFIRPEAFKEHLLNRALILGEVLPLIGQVQCVPPSYKPLRVSMVESLPKRMDKVPIIILDTKPKGIVVVGADTELKILEKTPKISTINGKHGEGVSA